MKRKTYIILASVILYIVVQIVLILKLKLYIPPIGEPPHKITEIWGWTIPFGGVNVITVVMSWVIMAILIIPSVLVTRKMLLVPRRGQLMFELLVGGFDDLCTSVLNSRKRGRRALPYIGTLFLFILLSNWVGVIPGAHEPTRDLNTCLGFGLIAFFVAHITAIRIKGPKRYIMDYFEPSIPVGRYTIPNVLFFPINVIGEMGKVVSHSFRLYGNIIGGAIIVTIVSSLTRYFMWPLALNFFFGLFVGTVQAFVFTMLALAYLAVLIEE